jgi:hypothetical protein
MLNAVIASWVTERKEPSFFFFCFAAGGGSAPVAGDTPAVQTPGSGSKATPSGYLQGSDGSSLYGPAGLVFTLAAAAMSAV